MNSRNLSSATFQNALHPYAINTFLDGRSHLFWQVRSYFAHIRNVWGAVFFGLGVFDYPRGILPFIPELFVTVSYGLWTFWRYIQSNSSRLFLKLTKGFALPALVYGYFHINYMYLLSWAKLLPYPNALLRSDFGDIIVLVIFAIICLTWGFFTVCGRFVIPSQPRLASHQPQTNAGRSEDNQYTN